MTDEELHEAQFALAVEQFGNAVSRFAEFVAAEGRSKGWFIEAVKRAAADAFDIEERNKKFPTLEQGTLKMTLRKDRPRIAAAAVRLRGQ
jgi:hypothetical protein